MLNQQFFNKKRLTVNSEPLISKSIIDAVHISINDMPPHYIFHF